MSTTLIIPSVNESYLSKQSSSTSLELWAASKIIGRECASVNIAFLHCKKSHDFPGECIDSGNLVLQCADNVVQIAREKLPVEYVNYQKCLDTNDYRHADCRSLERTFLDGWNKIIRQ